MRLARSGLIHAGREIRRNASGTPRMRGRREALAVIGRHEPESGLAEAHRLFEHRVEHRREIAGRGIDDLQHLGGRGLLLQRLVAFGGALGEQTAQLGIFAFEFADPVVNECAHLMPARNAPRHKLYPCATD